MIILPDHSLVEYEAENVATQIKKGIARLQKKKKKSSVVFKRYTVWFSHQVER